MAGLIAVPAADASPAASIITINATSPNYPGLRAKDHGLVDGHALVIYKIKKVDTAVISGTVTTTVTTDTATLLAKPFGTKSYKAVGSPVSLTTAGVNNYSFNVKPSLVTQYEVQVTGTDTGTSKAVPVYVTLANVVKSSKISCTSARCVQTLRVVTRVPTRSAYTVESRKHVYLYLAIGHLRGTKPILPKYFTLSTASTASKAKRINTFEFAETLKLIVPHPHANTIWEFNFCAKDTESTDGLGLPGHHGCGNRHFPRSAIYVG